VQLNLIAVVSVDKVKVECQSERNKKSTSKNKKALIRRLTFIEKVTKKLKNIDIFVNCQLLND